jgi:hypothetical protein
MREDRQINQNINMFITAVHVNERATGREGEKATREE